MREKPTATPGKVTKHLKKAAGNERDLRIRKNILDIAAGLFLAHGYDAVSLDSIIKKAGGSKTNIYRQFGDKEGLFTELVEYESARLRRPLEQLDVSKISLKAALALIAESYLAVIYSERTVSLHRLVISQGEKFPQVALTFAQNGPEGAVQTVAAIFQQLKKNRILATNRDPDMLARQFLDLMKIKVHAQLLLGISTKSKLDKTAAVKEGIRTFLNGYRG